MMVKFLLSVNSPEALDLPEVPVHPLATSTWRVYQAPSLPPAFDGRHYRQPLRTERGITAPTPQEVSCILTGDQAQRACP